MRISLTAVVATTFCWLTIILLGITIIERLWPIFWGVLLVSLVIVYFEAQRRRRLKQAYKN